MGSNFGELLSSELWAQILSRLDRGVGDGLCLRYLEPESLFAAQAEFFRLRTISRKFRDIFRVEAVLCRGLMLPFQLSDTQLSSLISWLKIHGSHIQTLAANRSASSSVKAVLDILPPLGSKLRVVFLSNVEVNPEWLLPFTNLTFCEFVEPESGLLDVTALSSLPKLAKLFLTYGHFTAQELPSLLTNLTLEGSEVDVEEACACVSSLQKLRVIQSFLSMPFAERLGTCPNVEELQLRSCAIDYIGDNDVAQQDWCDLTEEFVFPNLAALTRLKHLTIVHAGEVSLQAGLESLDTSWIYSLTGLQSLFLGVWEYPVLMSAGLTALQSLTSLTVSSGRSNTERNVVTMDLDWRHMSALQRLDICFPHLSCSSNLLGLSCLHNLKHLKFEGCQPQQDTPSCKYMCLLMYRLAKQQPHMQVGFDTFRDDINYNIVTE